jgi:hypothetical protein
MSDNISAKNVRDTTTALRAEADRGLQPEKLRSVAALMEQIWDAIERSDQEAIDQLGAALVQNRMSLPTPESATVWNATTVIDELLSHMHLQPPRLQ